MAFGVSMKESQQEYRLRPLNENDLDMVLRWRNSDRIRKASHQQELISEEEHQNWFRSLKSDPTKKSFVFETGTRPLGIVHFTKIDIPNKSCRWGFYLGEENLPARSGTTMAEHAINLAFEKFGVERIDAEALRSNPRSLDFHLKLGFKLQTEYKDYVCLSLMIRDWKKRKQS
jgi:UDP-4-amino-4,6-dideoxy-N-acetyl-beta-L-altrosamine N-acetyltransferase